MTSDSNLLIQLLESMNGIRWVILGIVLLILELITGTTYILWPAAAALIVGALGFIVPMGWELQFLLFFLLSSILLIVGHTHIRPKMKGGEPSDLNDRARQMVGMRVKAIADFETGRGRVQVGDTQWRASIDKGTAQTGQELRVIAVKGTTLMVEPI